MKYILLIISLIFTMSCNAGIGTMAPYLNKAAIVPNGLWFYYSFDTDKNDVFVSGVSNIVATNLAIRGTIKPSLTPGVSGPALRFFTSTTTNMLIVLTNSFNFTGADWTWCFWAYPVITNGMQWEVFNRTGNASWQSGGSRFFTVISGSTYNLDTTTYGSANFEIGVCPVSSIQSNNWYFFAVTYTNSNSGMSSYFNGVLASNKTLAVSGTQNKTLPLHIGNLSVGNPSGGWYDLDELRIYQRALSAAEILQIYNAGH